MAGKCPLKKCSCWWLINRRTSSSSHFRATAEEEWSEHYPQRWCYHGQKKCLTCHQTSRIDPPDLPRDEHSISVQLHKAQYQIDYVNRHDHANDEVIPPVKLNMHQKPAYQKDNCVHLLTNPPPLPRSQYVLASNFQFAHIIFQYVVISESLLIKT